MSVPFRERNPVVIGAISLAVIAGLLVVAFKAGDLPVVGGGDTYYASFTEAGGLKPNDEVRIAGVRVGKVRAVELKGSRVRVKFQVDSGAKFGKETGAEVVKRLKNPADDLDIPDLTDLISAVMEEAGENPPT